MNNLFETRYAKEIFEMKPNLPKAGITCEHYITDSNRKKSFYYWEGEYKELDNAGHIFSTADKYIIRFLNLPSEVRQCIHKRIFGDGWEYYGTKKSLYFASVACFKPQSIILSSVYSQAAYNAESEQNYKYKEQNFLNNIRKGYFLSLIHI